MSSLSILALISLIVVALAFDFLNGVHDTANSIATIVATRMLQPRYAVLGRHFSISSPFWFSACTWRELSAWALSLPTLLTRRVSSVR